jgi:hypothetical protein
MKNYSLDKKTLASTETNKTHKPKSQIKEYNKSFVIKLSKQHPGHLQHLKLYQKYTKSCQWC